MRYPALITKEDGATIALFRFTDRTECATQADKGEDIAALAAEVLELRLSSQLADGDAPPRPALRAPRAHRAARVLWVEVSPRLAAGLSLRWARQAAGLTQAQLAKRAGVSQQAVAKLENPNANPTLDTLEKVAHALGSRLQVSLERIPTAA